MFTKESWAGYQMHVDWILLKKTTITTAARAVGVSPPQFRQRFHHTVKERNPIMYNALAQLKHQHLQRCGWDIPIEDVEPDLSTLHSASSFFMGGATP